MSPRVESKIWPADSERLRRVAQIVLSSPDILNGRIGHVYCLLRIFFGLHPTRIELPREFLFGFPLPLSSALKTPR